MLTGGKRKRLQFLPGASCARLSISCFTGDTAGIYEHFSEPETVLRTHMHDLFNPHCSDMRPSISIPAGEAIVQSRSSRSGRTTPAPQVLIMTPQHGPKKHVCSGHFASHLISNYRNHDYFLFFSFTYCVISYSWVTFGMKAQFL